MFNGKDDLSYFLPVSFETLQEYDWAKGIINGKNDLSFLLPVSFET